MDKLESCNILGTDISVTDMKKTINWLCANIGELSGKYICISNVHTTILGYDDSAYQMIQNGAAAALPDGGPLSAVQRRRGWKNAARVTGPDLMEKIFLISAEHGFRHYFYGSTKQTLQLLRESLKAAYPGILIAGMYAPPFRSLSPAEDQKAVDEINRSNADFVWVGLGAPKQEQWMASHENKVQGLMIGVGAGFDYCAGNLKRAPKWMQRFSLEWLYRLWQEPGRLFKRYLVTNVKFLWLLAFGVKKTAQKNI